MLEAVGISPEEERFYFAVLEDQGAALATICRRLGIPSQRGSSLAATLEEKGLVSLASDRRPRLMAASPETALEPLLIRSQENLAETGRSIAELAERYRTTSEQRDPHELIEIVVGSDAVVRRHEQLQRSAREELRAFVRLPRAQPDRANRTAIRMLRKGVRIRGIYDRAALAAPGSLEEIALYQAEGEQVRAAESLPMKLVIADRTMAIVPLAEGGPVTGAILVHPSSLLDALSALFDSRWETAVPIGPEGAADQPDASALVGDDSRILGLLLAGMTDESVARQLGLSVRTVQRRVQRLMAEAGVTTRLQLGWHAHLHGWLQEAQSS